MKKFKSPTVKKLKQEYSLKIAKILEINNLSQTELADLIGTKSQNVNRWFNEVYLPSHEYREKIDKLFEETITQETLIGASNNGTTQNNS